MDSTAALTVTIAGHEDRAEYGRLWLAWLEGELGLRAEGEDIAAMADPPAFYGERGGAALLARLDGEVIGAVAIKHLSGGNYEFCKLIVARHAHGQGVGQALMAACLDFVRSRGGEALYLQSLYRLEAALRLYRRMGFVDCETPEGMNVLGRTQIIMKKAL